MKSKKMISEFWQWFIENSSRLSKVESDKNLLDALDQRVRDLNPRLSWEIGPGKVKEKQFVISPNLDKGLREEARSIISLAPSLDSWEFYPTRQVKDWDYQVRLAPSEEEPAVAFDASGWKFVLLRYPDGLREVLLSGKVPSLSDNQRWQAAAFVLESILGEDQLMGSIDEFDLVPAFEPRFAERQRPLQALKEAVQQ